MITNPAFASIVAVDDRLAKTKRIGTVYNVYRVMIATLFSVNFLLLLRSNGSHDYLLLINLFPTFGYLIFSFIVLICYYYFPKKSLAMAGLAVDAMVLASMLYFSGGTDLQVILLFLVTVAASFMLLRSNQAILITLFAITLVMYQQFYNSLKSELNYITLNNVGLMALSFIAVAYLSYTLSKRLTQIELLSQRQTNEMNALNAINEKIVQIIDQGVLVVSHKLDVLLANDTAVEQLQWTTPLSDYALPSLLPQLADTLVPIIEHTEDTTVFRLKRMEPESAITTAGEYTNYVDFRLRVTQLGTQQALILMEDLRREQSHAQQLKLASLGQLTASIAHEIRNPLAAISQASQLLLEDVNDPHSHLTEDDGMLYEMIFKQTKRVNQIIEDVLKLSRQQKPNQVLIAPNTWLAVFITEHFAPNEVKLICHSDARILFDPYQLEQVLMNLVNNGLRFSRKVHADPTVIIEVSEIGRFVYIDIIDTGDGVAAENLTYLFNPFFTTDHQGTGLGLYLSQAFCQANLATLQYIAHHSNTCFRITCQKHMLDHK